MQRGLYMAAIDDWPQGHCVIRPQLKTCFFVELLAPGTVIHRFDRILQRRCAPAAGGTWQGFQQSSFGAVQVYHEARASCKYAARLLQVVVRAFICTSLLADPARPNYFAGPLLWSYTPFEAANSRVASASP